MPGLTRSDVADIIEEAREFGNRPNLSRCDLRGVNLQGFDLFAVDFDEANLFQANLSQANLGEADLTKANLLAANFNQAKLHWANLNGAIIGQTIFADLDLRGVKNLEKVRHIAPSVLDLRTLQQSQGQIPEVFLRGCGLSNVDIEYTKLHNRTLATDRIIEITDSISRTLQDNPLTQPPCFITYAKIDRTFAEKLHHDLQDRGIRCWNISENLMLDDDLRQQLYQSLRMQAKLLLVLSQHTLDSSWVEQVIEVTNETMQEQDDSVWFLLCLEETVLVLDEDWPNHLRKNQHISDFSKWKDQNIYHQAFERLLRDLV